MRVVSTSIESEIANRDEEPFSTGGCVPVMISETYRQILQA
jgi:hypothetical protein